VASNDALSLMTLTLPTLLFSSPMITLALLRFAFLQSPPPIDNHETTKSLIRGLGLESIEGKLFISL
jgi:hypothetical protein